MDDAFWLQPLGTLQAQLDANPAGLSSAEAAARLTRVGPNVLRPRRERALVLEFLSHFLNPLVIILLLASGVSALTGDAASFFIISAIVLMSVTLDVLAGPGADADEHPAAEHAAGR
jgi:Mg2+-importing ATPase